MKLRHPDEFSDSSDYMNKAIPRPVLESFFLNLTSRNEQDDFESFAFKLAQKEIIPNLKPNTGPAGGGDGKTDAEEFPVSELVAAAFYVGFMDAAKKKSTALAISAKAKWKQKIRDDAREIASTGRKFDTVYFISSRYIKADQLKSLEKEVKDAYVFEAHILDLSWILDRIYEGKRLELVLDNLKVDPVESSRIVLGPNDSRREIQILNLEEKITNAIKDELVTHGIVEDSIDASELAREQQSPQVEVVGKHDRSIRLADKFGSKMQKFKSRYQYCWTLFWWYEDYTTFKKVYVEAEKYALEAGGIDNLEHLSSLRQLLASIRNGNKVLVPKAFYEEHTKKLKEALESLADDDQAPSTSLFSRLLIEQIIISDKVYAREVIDDSIGVLNKMLDQSKGLVGFPFRFLAENVKMMGEYYDYNQGYEDLFKRMTDTVREREGNSESARLMLDRANTLFDKDQQYRTIQVLGASLEHLHTEETVEDATDALILMGRAYASVGLIWAARGSFLSAASLATAEFYKSEKPDERILESYDKILQSEVRLGRISQAFQWFELLTVFVQMLSDDEWNLDNVYKHLMMVDMMLGATILTTENNPSVLSDVINISNLVGLDNTSIASLYMLGQEALLPPEFTENIAPEDYDRHFKAWALQVDDDFVAKEVLTYDKEDILLKTRILGMEVTVQTKNDDLLIITSESILGALEGILATTILNDGIARESEITIEVKKSINGISKALISHSISEKNAHPHFEVYVNDFNPNSIPVAKQHGITEQIFHLLADVIASSITFKDLNEALRQIFVSERSISRALNFTSSFVRLGNVVGFKPKFRLKDWAAEINNQVEYTVNDIKPPLKRTDIKAEKNGSKKELKNANQQHLEVLSVIRNSLWDEAKWKAVVYSGSVSGETPPLIAIAFTNPEAGKKIFEDWYKRFGDFDSKDDIRISIVKEVDPLNLAYYRVGISQEIENVKDRIKGQFVTSPTRIHTMTPSSLVNLDRFEKDYLRFGTYYIAQGVMDSETSFRVDESIVIQKRKINIIKASDIKPNDPDSPMLHN